MRGLRRPREIKPPEGSMVEHIKGPDPSKVRVIKVEKGAQMRAGM